MRQVTDAEAAALLARFGSLQQHQRQDGQRSPHKPLLVLLALGRLAAIGSSELPWSAAESALGELIAEFGPPSGQAARKAPPTHSPGCAMTRYGYSTRTCRWTW